ncbi:MAG: urease accessory protein UreD 2 [Fibrobacterota bacterium]|jgi:urease accessory protein
MLEASLTESVRHWPAHLELGYGLVEGRTVPVHRRHHGPLRVQRALYPEGDRICQQILLHPPGGMAGGDRLRLDVDVEIGAQVQITTPGAGKWYRASGNESGTTVSLRVSEGACLEWLPQETIVFDGAQVCQDLSVSLEGDAVFCGWEIQMLGRSACQETFSHGRLEQSWSFELDGRLLAWESGELEGGETLLEVAPGWAGECITGTFWLAGVAIPDSLFESAQGLRPSQGQGGITRLPGLSVARVLCQDIRAARSYFLALWQLLRPHYAGRAAVPPRIWST